MKTKLKELLNEYVECYYPSRQNRQSALADLLKDLMDLTTNDFNIAYDSATKQFREQNER